MRKYLALVLLIAFACKEESITVCSTNDPANDLPWLKEKIDNIKNSPERKYFQMEQAEYNGQFVFYANNCCPYCSTIMIYYDCDGNALESVDNSKLKNFKTIWKPDDFACLW